MIQYFNQLCDILYPPLCQNCEAEIKAQSEFICLHCIDSLPYISENQNLIIQNRLNNLIPINLAYSCFYSSENNIIQRLIKSFKYSKNLEAGEFLSEKMASDFKIFCDLNNCSFDYIVPVPIHRHKKIKRGYNQSEIISNFISKKLNISINNQLIIKKNISDSQTTKSRLRRMTLQESVFHVNQDDSISNQHILIVDDILTTGATLEKCVNLLRHKYPLAKFSIATLALSSF